ncbi:lysophospholipid acyltransferase family protein [Pseudoruegeria sp. SHC-113]|uniref:lysophospholipid acyltransferase family protein n=1 Tax=Pseudoruegeria sp. SHC-113 TaxID=2855439 RepID=UPI0021BBA015|nr:lysophospholipid acyltransferase family protein [Pseudoruegeria sp. SHC-113]MCT8159287.1 lysophospholipid acyltransferase family protein [Pseudoruegeria sp. SHC-113]
MMDETGHGKAPAEGEYVPYDKRQLSYANTFPNPFKANVIRTMEWCTGKIPILRRIRQFEREGVEQGQGFWSHALRLMGVELQTPDEQIRRIPKEGPVVIVANHPHGLVDGIVLAELVGRVRTDYKILTRSLLTGVDEVKQFMIPVPFPHEDGAQEKSLDMRRQAMAHLAEGGVIVLFPSGVVATSDSWFGPVIEKEWNPFTSKMVKRSGATVVPVYFPGQNSRAYQIANQISATLRQGLLLHEVAHALNRPQAPVVGYPITPEEISRWEGNATEFVAYLRARTLALRTQPQARGLSLKDAASIRPLAKE